MSLLFALVPLANASVVGSALERQIEQYIKSLRSNGSISSSERTAWLVYDLTAKKRMASINENLSVQAASMIKPLAALAYFHQVKVGKLRYNSTARGHLEAMIQKSSNTSTNWVIRQVGGPAKTQALLKRYYPSVSQQLLLVEYIPTSGRTYRNRSSAGDYARYLTAMWRGQLPYWQEMKRLLGLPGRDRLFYKAKRVPAGTKVYNKTGSTAMCCGDMGILVVNGRDGRFYPYIVIGIIENQQRSHSYSSWISSRGNVIREVSNLSYLEMKRRYAL